MRMRFEIITLFGDSVLFMFSYFVVVVFCLFLICKIINVIRKQKEKDIWENMFHWKRKNRKLH